MPANLLQQLRSRGEVSEQIVLAVQIFLDLVDVPAKPPRSLDGKQEILNW